MSSLLISDLHLSASRPEVVERFMGFVEQRARACERLYILGDLFDVWVGDDDSEPPIPQVEAALARLAAHQVRVLLQRGNRDFLIGEEFARRTGVELMDDPWLLDTGDRPTLLMHGDLLCSDDIAYQQARRYLRDPATIRDFLAKPLEERRQLAAAIRAQSGEAISLKSEDIMDVNPQTLIHYLQTYGAGRLIHGHTHRPGRHEHCWEGGSATRYVLPEWTQEGGGYLELVGDEVISGTC